MRRAFALAILFSVQNALSEQPSCRSPLGVPCYTIRGTHTQWQAFRQGVTDITKFKSDFISALRRDGSHMDWQEQSFGGIFESSGRTFKMTGLYLAPEKTIVSLNHTEKTVSRREPLIWHDLPYRRSQDHDDTCRTGILHWGTDFSIISNSAVAGIPVVKWSRSLGNGSEDLYLAPLLDCIALKSYRIQKNAVWIPTMIDSSEVTSVDLKEPAPELFAVPAEYRVVENRERARLLQHLKANQGRGAVAPLN